MAIELEKQTRIAAIASIQRYFDQNMEEPIGNISAAALLSFFLEEIGPVIHNQAILQAQERLLERVSELDLDLREDELAYWRRYELIRGIRRG